MTRMVLAIVITALLARTATARTDTAFTYQGELRDGGTLANGSYALDISLWDSLAGGVQIGATTVFAAVPVTDGRFTVQLDYGAAAFDNSDRWLQIDVNATPLAPRQPITRAPYSIQTRGIFVDNAGNVGIGTGAPSVPLEVIGAGNGTGVRGEGFVGVLGEGSTWPLGAPTGVKGVSGSVAALGFGVWGLDKAGSSIVNFAPAGVYGESATDAGVLGHSDSGDGVRGESLTGNAGYFQGKVYVDGDATFNGAVYVGGGGWAKGY